jgi:DNA-binding LacI/PurR family transcriptional regulator
MTPVPTMRDVAQAAGLSLFTVSKVLNGLKVRDATRDKVLQACEILGYERNPHAVGLVSRRTKTIGMIVSQIVNPFYGEILEAAETASWGLGYQITYQCSYLDPAVEASVIRHFQALKVCGIIIAPVVARANRGLLLRMEERFPVVYVDRYFDGECNYVVNDNAASAATMTGHLLERGTTPAYLGSPRGGLNRALEDREMGYRRTMRMHGREPILIPVDHSAADRDNEQAGYDNIRAWLEASPAPESLFCANDSLALGAMRALTERGLSVGRDVLVAGHDNLSHTAYLNPPLTTMAQPKEEMGRRAVQTLVDLDRGERAESPVQVMLQSQLCIRESTAGKSGDPAARAQEDA